MLNTLDTAIFTLALILCVGGLYRMWGRIRLGAPEDRSDAPAKRRSYLLSALLGHRKIRKEGVEGRNHYWLFLAFLAMLLLIVIAQLPISLPWWIAGPIALLVDILGFLGFLGVLLLAKRRYFEKPDRLDEKFEDSWGLLLLILLFATGLLLTGMRIAVAGDVWNIWHPIGFLVSLLLPAKLSAALVGWVWRIHLLLIVATIALLPFGKLSHVIFGAMNIYFRNRGPKGAFSALDIENSEVFGVGQVEHFTWKQLLDLEACVRCGRCQSRCPAHNTGKELNPKQVIQDLRSHLVAKAPAIRKGEGDSYETPMIDGGGVSQEQIWDCTTCRACMEICPMEIEHVDKIVDMRRYMVLMEGQMPEELILLNKNMENNFNPWGVGWSDRNNWMARRGVSPRILSEEENPNFDILFWVGCAGSFDDRYQRVVASVCRILDRAGVSYGVLGMDEKCCGDPARSTGNEYLYQSMVMENIAAMDKLGVTKIVTSCPHCLKTLDKEYPQFDGNYEVVHHSEFIQGLIDDGKIKLNGELPGRFTLHDSCYLSRYAGITDAPRTVLAEAGVKDLAEMERNLENNFCCGAGGGKMFMEEEGERINVNRTKEALSTGADTICTACPFCLTMIGDGVKAEKKEEEVSVLDMAEIVEKAMV
ncbi:MAG: iron-sulfur-binding reductase [Deltaproteobacteria bacterium]|nr:MAG: iron-sulfur-binding reductase [Deltaproteobacteria bacterium]